MIILVINHFVTIPYCVYFVLALVSTRCLNTVKKLVRGLGNQKLFALSGIIYTVIYLALNVIQIVWMGRGVAALFSSTIIANLISIFVLFLVESQLRVNFFEKPDRNRLIKMLQYSIPLVPNLLNWWVINSSDRYIVRGFLGLASNGILSVAGKFPTALDMVISLFSTSWQDVSIADTDAGSADRNAFYSGVFRTLYRTTMSMLWFLIPMTKAYVLLTMEASYAGSADIVAFYYLGSVFRGFSSFYGVGYLRSGNTRMAFRTSVVAAVVNVIIHLSLIRFLGLQAAPLSTFIAFFVMWLIRQRQNSEELGITIRRGEFALLLIVDVLLSVIIIKIRLQVCLAMTVIGGIGFLIFNRKMIKMVPVKLLGRFSK
jgi:O-antigen/teichoic acid export membrane protein